MRWPMICGYLHCHRMKCRGDRPSYEKIPQLALQIHPRKLACLLKIVVGRRPVSFEMDPFLGDMLAFRVYFWVGVYLCTRRWIMFDWFPFRAKKKIQKALVDEVCGSMPARFAFWHVSSNKAIHPSFFIFSSLYVSTMLSISHIINVSPSSVMFVFMPYPLVVFSWAHFLFFMCWFPCWVVVIAWNILWAMIVVCDRLYFVVAFEMGLEININ